MFGRGFKKLGYLYLSILIPSEGWEEGSRAKAGTGEGATVTGMALGGHFCGVGCAGMCLRSHVVTEDSCLVPTHHSHSTDLSSVNVQ